MRQVLADDLLAALERKGFEEVDARTGGRRRSVRREEGRHDHVRLTLAPARWWSRLARRPRVVEQVVVGIVWPIGEMAFSRPVPDLPMLPQQAHAVTSFDRLVVDRPTDVATIAAAVDDWCRRLEDPAHALALGAIREPVVRLEFAVVTTNREVGLAAAEQARTDARELEPAPRRTALHRIELAEQRLPKA